MTDLWSFLLQTLTASGAAVLLLVVKALFRDKLSPRWQFAVWGILGLVLLVPAGLGGRYVLLNWPLVIEAFKSLLAGDYSLTYVLAPIPLPRLHVPIQAVDWLYLLYVAGVLVLLVRYLLLYARLRHGLGQGTPAGATVTARIEAVAKQYGLAPCRAVEVPGLTSAFVCGLFRPVLVLPAGTEPDDKVLLHELLHLKYRDVGWGLVICFFRCIHWCNPLLWYCADQAGNDLEARCDQRVLELLSGEERRDYGRILLSMADDRYARAPGTSSMANGGRHIRRRIEAITWFKKYPAGMGLVSICTILLLAVPLLLGTWPQALYYSNDNPRSSLSVNITMASARTLYCTTPDGAVDTYAKSLLAPNGYYRAMCAPLSEQAALADRILQNRQQDLDPLPDTGLPAWPATQSGYALYNFLQTGETAYEGLLMIELSSPPDGQPKEEGIRYLAVQTIQVEKEGSRWVVIPVEDFRTFETPENRLNRLDLGCYDLPAFRYEAQACDFTIRLDYQEICTVDSYIQNDTGFLFPSYPSYDTTPKPHAAFTIKTHAALSVIYTGDPADKDAILSVGASCAPLLPDGTWPAFSGAGTGTSGGSSSNGSLWGSRELEAGWDPEEAIFLGGGGTGRSRPEVFAMPDAFAAKFYLNEQKVAELTLLPVEGGIDP